MNFPVYRPVYALVLVASYLLAGVCTVFGATIDLASEFTVGPATVSAGGDAKYTVAYSNLSDFAPTNSYLNVDFPVGAFVNDPIFSVGVGDTLGNVGDLYVSSSCESLLIQLQGPGNPDQANPLVLPPQTTGEMTFSFVMPMTSVTTRALRVQYPGTQPVDIPFTIGVCDDCDDLATCFGPRISSVVPPLESEYVIVDDEGPGGGTLGCVSIKNDIAGRIALVRRGDCEFGLKAMNVQIAGGLGCVIMNNDPAQDVTTFAMLGGEFGALVEIPVALINNAEADPMEAAIVAGDTLLGLLGGAETEEFALTSLIFHGSDSLDQDPNPDNDSDTFVTLFPFHIFTDGFESGDTTAWSETLE